MASGRNKRLEVKPAVFWGATGIIFAILAPSTLIPDQIDRLMSEVHAVAVTGLGWLYVLAMTGFLSFVGWLLLSRHGRVKLGPDDSEPEFSRPTWFAMLFSAGMGIGLMFFSVAEPLKHYARPPTPAASEAEAVHQSLALTFFHWGLHPWAVYALAGLAFAYFAHRRGLPLSMRSALHPLLGERVHGRLGDAVDILAIVSTLFGVATSLGLGAMQVAAGLHRVLGVEVSDGLYLGLIAAITAAATISVVTGLKAGVRRLSELNMSLAGLLLVLVLVLGPTLALLTTFAQSLVAYVSFLPTGSFRLGLAEPARVREWMADWTIFYWAWWIAWAPFVGMFIARVSRGRTIREFLLGVLIVPSLMGLVWLAIFGGTGLHAEVSGAAPLAAAVEQSLPTAIFVMLESLPGAGLTSVICILCVVLFFVTSSDSASLVIDTIASGGHDDPPVGQRIYWAGLEGAVAAVLLLAGGLKALQTGVITTALPFTLVLVAVCVGLVLALRAEETEETEEAAER